MNTTRRDTMLLVIAVLVLTVRQSAATPLESSLGLDDSSYWEAVVAKQAQDLEELSENVAEGFRVDLMQFHHEKSPYGTPNLSLEERISIAVKSSLERAELFNSQIAKQISGSRYSSKAVFTSPVYSNQGSYLMQVQLGTPPKRFVVIADTGSDLVWVQCDPCNNCFSQPDALFNPSQSSSYGTTSCTDYLCNSLPRRSCTTGCQYQYAYGDQSTTQGAFSTETITLESTSGGSQSFPNFGFGCGTQNQGTFSGCDGLLGLGQGPLSLVRQLGGQFGEVFSYCLTSFYTTNSKTSPLLLGSSGGATSFTPLITNPKNPSFYYANLEGISVNGRPLNIPAGTFSIDSLGNGGFILDSGTTITQLQTAAYTPLVSALSSLISYTRVDGSRIGFDLCYDLSGVANPSVPSVTFQFQNLAVDLPGNNIFLQVTNTVFCLAIQGSSFGFGIYGNVQQQNFVVSYDRNSQQIGFAARTC